ncbi:MOSC domain-containing protein [Pseudomassariella vexata]|uniref:MOSC domain-containing protein n=1 Tax=Pseudomassariella vexata TaxID=1141098 RepID=A0A1Y2DX98_9PEZI|nr:MOSC domain-containing protein [Pseudomassariella vexata]ORY63245.1 MOSC domain-containing protein [Pseudomassariella vexata]
MGDMTLDVDMSGFFLLFATICAFLVPIVLILPPVPLQKSDALLQTHSKAGLAPSKSNLKSQLSPEHKPRDGQAPKIQSLMIYPVKSCKGIEVAKAKVVPQGLEFDRLFTFAQLKSPFPVDVDSADEEGAQHKWEFITLRQFARLANVTVELWLPDEMKLRKQSLKSQETFLIIRFPWKELGWRGFFATVAAKLTKGWRAEAEIEVLLPADFPTNGEIKDRGYTYEDVKIWKDTTRALNMEKEIPEELRLYLGVSNKMTLFRIDPTQLREVYRCAPRKDVAGYQPVMGFQDAYPLHLMNLNSFQQFNSEVPKDADLKQLDVRRFRPNILKNTVSCSETYDEETWKRIRCKSGTSGLYNDAVFQISCRTVRCKLPNVDPVTGIRHPIEPDKSLRKLRSVDEGAPFKGCLGMQATPLFEEGASEEEMEGWIGVGMTIEVEQRGEHVYVT